MEQLQIAVVDDNPADRQWLTDKLDVYMKGVQLPYALTAYPSGEAFLADLETHTYDLVFMDVYMTGITGVETATALRQHDRTCKLVFLTSTPDFMPQGFALNSRHYLIKPLQDEDLVQAMENCALVAPFDVPTLTIESMGQLREIPTGKLLYMDVVDRKAILHTTAGTIDAGRNFTPLSQVLAEDRRFLLCIKGVMVNMDFIARQEQDCFALTNGEVLFFTPRRQKEILTAYHNHLMARILNPT